ncbi:maleylpyruvate isomerase N-terminal domain-containing protein [Dactylosporangium sp. CA-139066]|uniref:maleylpyruvate isomerase N-terminal domain-containing protein n=1 Tax=Dactylosporangium sp. CA-139066 TaxID=3239930 RepID=UPI003D8F8F72
MERSRLLQCLAADYMRLREVATTGLNAQVPSCPGWTVSDLVRHVGQVYLHKALVMQAGAWPEPWPPATTATEDPIALLDRAYGALTHEFSRRGDTDHALTWHEPDQTVKFWIRRMAQESVIHRLDAELAHDTEPAPIPDDLALDGIDEVLQVMAGYGSHAWHEDLTDQLAGAKGRTVRVQSAAPSSTAGSPATAAASAGSSAAGASPAFAGSSAASSPAAGATSAGSSAAGASPASAGSSAAASASAAGSPSAQGGSPVAESVPAWLVRIDPEGATITPVTSATAATTGPAATMDLIPDAVVTGPPAHLLRWLWSRESTPTTDAHSPVQVDGDEEAINELQALLRALTQ